MASTPPASRAGPIRNATGLSDPSFHQFFRSRFENSLVEELTYTGDLNLEWDGSVAGRRTTLKTGAKYLHRDKFVNDHSDRWLWDTLGQPRFYLNEPGYFTPFSSQFGSFDIGPASYREAMSGYPSHAAFRQHFDANRARYWYDEASSRGNSIEDDYELIEKVYAGYLMGTFHVSPALNFTGGVRLEETRTSLTGTRAPEQGDLLLGLEKVGPLHRSYTNWLPNLQTRWAIRDHLVFRAAATATLGRPDYRAMGLQGRPSRTPVPGRPNVYSGSVTEGNPDLQPYEAFNYDLSLSYYLPRNLGMVSLGWFHKEIDNAIYTYVYDAVSDSFQKSGLNVTRLPNGNIVYFGDEYESFRVTTQNNARRGTVTGTELTYQHDLSFLPAPFDGFGFTANASFIDSEVGIFQRPGEKFPFFRQADKLYNAQLYYQKGPFEARIGWHYQGPAFLQPGPDAFRDLYEAESETMDARVSYQFNRRFGAYVSVKNLTNEPQRAYWANENLLGFGVGESGGGHRVFGTTYYVGLKWNFDR